MVIYNWDGTLQLPDEDCGTTDLKIKTGSSIYRSEMKSFAAILVGPIQYIEISLGAAFSFDDCWNVMNAQQ